RALYLAHNDTIGFYLRPSKWQAIEAGDLSGTVIHPAMIRMALLIGGIYWSMQPGRGQPSIDEDYHLQCIHQSLAQQPPDSVTSITVYCQLSWYGFVKREFSEGQAYLMKAHDIVRQHHLQICSPDMLSILDINQPDDDTKEMVTILCQMIYIDKASQLVLELSSVLPKDFDHQLQQLPTFQPWLCKHSVVVSRTRGAYFLQKALRLSSLALVTGFQQEMDSSEWYGLYWSTLEETAQHAAALTTEMLKASLCTDSRKAATLKVCLIICLSAQLELHRLPGLYHPESRQKVVDGVNEIVGLTRGFKDEEVSLLDPILGVCWTIVATALRQEKEAFVDMSSLAPDGNWARAFSVMISCASKVGSRIPFLGEKFSGFQVRAPLLTLVHLSR
ncbi:hypothetical protein BC835DRAFT_1272624, partial [Cytidiella melzeri]